MFPARSETEASERIRSGASWNDFCDTLKAAGAVILREGSPDDAFTRAEGFRYLSRLVRAGLEAFLEHADPRAPALRRTVHETVKMGADNPDNLYQNAAVSGQYEYRITGRRGTVRYLSFSTQSGGYGEGLGLPATGYLEAGDLAIDPDGRFEIQLSCEPRDGNWLPMKPDTGLLIVRQTFGDRAVEIPAQLAIERAGADRAPASLTPLAVDRGLTRAANLVGGAAALFAGWADFRTRENQLPRFDPALSTAFGGDPGIAYYHGYWRVAPGEALIIEAVPPACEYWNFQLNNHWMESLDYRHHRIAVNSATARLGDDGSLRIVVAHDDPGHDNWINPAGHTFGTMCLRWVRASSHPEPATRLVKL